MRRDGRRTGGRTNHSRRRGRLYGDLMSPETTELLHVKWPTFLPLLTEFGPSLSKDYHKKGPQ
jgi:hypothetical protein